MPTSPDLARAARKIEDMPVEDGSVLDCLAGAILRIFVRINQIERVHAGTRSHHAPAGGAGTGDGAGGARAARQERGRDLVRQQADTPRARRSSAPPLFACCSSNRSRRVAKDFENLAETLATFVTLASIQLALRRLVRE
jgi:hypothetical protein